MSTRPVTVHKPVERLCFPKDTPLKGRLKSVDYQIACLANSFKLSMKEQNLVKASILKREHTKAKEARFDIVAEFLVESFKSFNIGMDPPELDNDVVVNMDSSAGDAQPEQKHQVAYNTYLKRYNLLLRAKELISGGGEEGTCGLLINMNDANWQLQLIQQLPILENRLKADTEEKFFAKYVDKVNQHQAIGFTEEQKQMIRKSEEYQRWKKAKAACRSWLKLLKEGDLIPQLANLDSIKQELETLRVGAENEKKMNADAKAAVNAEAKRKRDEAKYEADKARKAQAAAKAKLKEDAKAQADEIKRAKAAEAAQKAAERARKRAEKQDADTAKDAANRRPFQTKWPDATDSDWEIYKTDRKVFFTKKKNARGTSGYTVDQWNLEVGNKQTAIDQVREHLRAEDAFRYWNETQNQEYVKVQLLEIELKLVKSQLVRSRAAKATDSIKALSTRLSNRFKDITTELESLGQNVKVVDPFEVWKWRKTFPSVTEDDFAEYEQAKARQNEERKAFLEDDGNTVIDWKIKRGLRYRAEDEIRAYLTYEEAFPESTWNDVKQKIQYIRQRIEAREYDLHDDMIKFLESAIDKSKTEAVNLRGEKEEGIAAGTWSKEHEERLIKAEDAAYYTERDNKKMIEVVITPRLEEFFESKQEVARIESEMKAEAVAKRRLEREAERQRKNAERRALQAEASAARKRANEAERVARAAEKNANKEEARLAKREADRLKREQKKAEIKEKKARRTRIVDSTFVARIESSGKKDLQISLSLAVVDKEQKRVQQIFDDQQTAQVDTSLPMSEFDFPWLVALGLKYPEQPTQERSRSEGGGVNEDRLWPVTQMRFTSEQHDLLFVTESNAFPDGIPDADADNNYAEEGDGETLDYGSAAKPVTRLPQLVASDADNEMDISATLDTGFVSIGVQATKQLEPHEEARDELLGELSSDDIYGSELLLFNKKYARHLLSEHLRSLKQQHVEILKVNSKALYVDLAGALGPVTVDPQNPESSVDEEKLSLVVEELLPCFESMLRYRNTILKVKERELIDDLELIGNTQPSRVEQMKRDLAEIQDLKVPVMWGKVAAKRLLMSERGQLPGQLYTPQPFFLPLRISAPPRVGKSATALLVASLAKRIGMTSFYSVSPNKTSPIAEITKKLVRIGWRSLDEAAKADNNLEASLKGKNIELTCMRQIYNWSVIDDVYTQAEANMKSVCVSSSTNGTDMILYSSDVLGDVQRVGALLSTYRRTKTVVFHIRDEAQSLAKEEKNEFVACHKEFIPPKPVMQYLRYYFGNMFGLNCNVTATHFPTLLEEGMFGYFGSTSQNVRAGLPISATTTQIQRTLGSNYLPVVVPSLRAYVSPGYIGVDHVVAWRYTADIIGVPLKKDGKQMQTPNGTLMWEARAKNMGDVAALQLGTSHSGIQSDGTVKSAFKSSEMLEAKLKAQKRSHNVEKASVAQKKLDDAAQKIWEETQDRLAQDVKLTTEQILLKGAGGGDGDDLKDANYSPNNPKLSKSEVRRLKAMYVKEDKQSIDQHFEDWLESREQTIDAYRDESEPVENFTGTKDVMVPMYIGALNNEVADDAMVSFVRHFGTLAHNRTKNRIKPGKTASKQEYGVAFLLFQSIFKNRKDVETKGGGIRFHDDTELDEVDGVPAENKFRPCDGPSSKPVFNLLCCVYNPEEERNGRNDPISNKPQGEPAFEMFFAPNAEAAIEDVFFNHQISKIAILGYGMLEAGLTVQSNIEVPLLSDQVVRRTRGQSKRPIQPKQIGTYNRMYCPQYVALATSDNASLDAQLQIVGRSFVELKGHVAPQNWRIQLLGVHNIVSRLVNYSNMESILAGINSDGKNLRLYEALKEKFGYALVEETATGLGTVGVRRGEFSNILGMTAKTAARRSKAAAYTRKKAEEAMQRGSILTEDQLEALAKETYDQNVEQDERNDVMTRDDDIKRADEMEQNYPDLQDALRKVLPSTAGDGDSPLTLAKRTRIRATVEQAPFR